LKSSRPESISQPFALVCRKRKITYAKAKWEKAGLSGLLGSERLPSGESETGMKLRLTILIVALEAAVSFNLRAQEAATTNIQSKNPGAQAPQALSPAPSPPELPELSELDQAFKKTTLGKEADEQRMRIKLRELENRAANDPAVIAAKAAANTAPTDLEKRERLRYYYNLCYGRMAAEADSPDVKAAVERSKVEHIALLSQPRVRPGSGESPSPKPKKKKKKHHLGSK
jgi:hypothetical protein